MTKPIIIMIPNKLKIPPNVVLNLEFSLIVNVGLLAVISIFLIAFRIFNNNNYIRQIV